MELDLNGKRVLVTGASRGIGAEIAMAFAAEGCNVLINGRDESLLSELADTLKRQFGVDVTTVVSDLGTPEGVEALVAQCGEIDVLVNNAGAIPGGRLDDVDDETWQATWNVKVYGYIRLCRTYFASMKRRRYGVIINIIGASGQRPKANYICGATANAALIAFTEALGGDSLDHGVRVLGINPGPVETERLVGLMKSSAKDRLGDAERWRELLGTLPGGRAATTSEIAATAIFAASSKSAYTTGTVITIDGGYCNRGSLM